MSRSSITPRPPAPHPSGARPPALPAGAVPRHVALLVAALMQWHLERGLRSLPMVDREVGA